MKTRTLWLAFALVSALLPASARADGPVVLDENLLWFGGSTPSVDGVRYMTLRTPTGTVVAEVSAATGEVAHSRFLRSRFSVPLVAFDGSTSGLSADGKTLVLIQPRGAFPRSRTTFTMLETQRLKTQRTFTLRGDFGFDAISRDARWLYLVQYFTAQDPSRYLVRAYDLERHRLLPDPIIDPREVGDVMRGRPVTRSYSPDGRYAYTLYDGAGEHPFIHALDTVEKSARCIDLHGLMGFQRLAHLKLDVSPGGETIAVDLEGEPVALVDTQTNEVTEPAVQTAAAVGDPSSVPWLLVAGAAASLLLVLFGVQRLLKRPRVPLG
jgi:hypothetical protein